MAAATEIDLDKLEAFAGQLVGFLTRGSVCAGIVLGDVCEPVTARAVAEQAPS